MKRFVKKKLNRDKALKDLLIKRHKAMQKNKFPLFIEL